MKYLVIYEKSAEGGALMLPISPALASRGPRWTRWKN